MRFVQDTVVGPTRWQLVIQPFAIANTWHGTNQLIASGNIGNTYPFCIDVTTIQPSTSCIAAIRWTDANSNTFRVLLWNVTGAALYYPIYTGQVIGANAVVEVWNVNNNAVASASINLNISMLNQETRCPVCDVVTSIVTVGVN